MSLVRIGMSENKGYADGYEAIFGKRDRFKPADPKPADAKPESAGAEPAADAVMTTGDAVHGGSSEPRP